MSEQDKFTSLTDTKKFWLEEIIRETDHYFQGEIQQDQRASWLLATVGVFIAIAVSFQFVALEKGYKFTHLPLILAFISFVLGATISILTLLPIRGRLDWKDIFGKTYRRSAHLKIDQLIEERFRCGENWSAENLEKRVIFHFRSHYLRSNLKAYGILWAAIFSLMGVIFLILAAISIIL